MPPVADPLAGLRPLHSPPPVSWWPPAPGWWLLAGTILLASGLILLWYRRTRVRRAALAEIAALGRMDLGAEEQLRQLAALLKRYALYCFPAERVAALSGEEWLRFLDEHGGRGEFANGCGRVLGCDLFKPGTAGDLEALIGLVRRWIRKNRRRG